LGFGTFVSLLDALLSFASLPELALLVLLSAAIGAVERRLIRCVRRI
jgi:hypothetical protein